MTRILGLDLGTNSIGWALLTQEKSQFVDSGSRIIPMAADAMSAYDKGQLQSAASARTLYRLARRRGERSKLRRSRLLRVLNLLGWLPPHYVAQIDFGTHPGEFKTGSEPLIAYQKGADGKNLFLFEDAFQEMLSDFGVSQPGLVAQGRKIPHDWTLYYLRHKALSQPLTREQLAWVLLSFNTKRGYYQLGDDGDSAAEAADKQQDYRLLKVKSVTKQEADKKRPECFWYEIEYCEGLQQKVCSPSEPCAPGDVREAIVTTQVARDGTVKSKVTTPKEVDWTLRKKRTESELTRLGLTVGSYIYTSLLREPEVKVRGRLVHTVDRINYRNEAEQILARQAEFHPELRDPTALRACLQELYPRNEPHRRSYHGKTLAQFLTDDILFYQRPLKSKKGTIDECPFEARVFRNKQGDWQRKPLRCIPKSHPLYGEYRLWQFVANLRIYKRTDVVDGRLAPDVDVTDRFFPDHESKAALYQWLSERDKVSQKTFLAYKPLGLKTTMRDQYHWNYQEDKDYPCNPTGHTLSRLAGKGGLAGELDEKAMTGLWHILYSVTDPEQRRKALSTFAKAHGVAEPEKFSGAFRGVRLDDGYGAYSEKAVRKLVALMRQGSRWSAEAIDPATLRRIEALTTGAEDPSLTDQVRERLAGLASIDQFQGLPQWQAAYAVYGRHSEAPDLARWNSPSDIDAFLENFRQHSLRNPVVESLVMETLRTVRDIWKAYGSIDEIHVETARNLKQTAAQRLADTRRNLDNQAANTRIRRLLQEFAQADAGVEGVRPYSPSQQEILKIYEQTVLDDPAAKRSPSYAEMAQIARGLADTKDSKVSHADVLRYKLWLEQHYRSPYTGAVIPISQLFTTAYEIEHIIPQSRFFDDSLSNKVICETAVNRGKKAMLGYEYILAHGGETIDLGGGKSATLLMPAAYEAFVKEHYAANAPKMRKLLMEDIPQEFAERQMNDTRYMTRYLLSLLSHIVREADETAAVSKHVIPTSGAVTDRLKRDWGLDDVWADLMAPRFRRLNELKGSCDFGQEREKDGHRFFQCTVPEDLRGGFSLKRIDHRHHALDAMVIACTTRSMVAYLNNVAAADSRKDERIDLRTKLCEKLLTDSLGNYRYRFRKPWPTFTQDVRTRLEGIVVSVKKNLRVLTRTSNRTRYIAPDGTRAYRLQAGRNMAVRKPLHKESVSGSRRGSKPGELLAVRRVPLSGFEKRADVEKVYNSDVRNILLRHLDNFKGNGKEAFSPDGIAEMNANIAALNGGRPHKPIYSVKKKEALGTKFALGTTGAKTSKYVEAQQGTILFAAVYEDEKGKRSHRHIPLIEVLECRRQGLPVAPAVDAKGRKLVMVLSPGDVVMLPGDGTVPSRLYQMRSAEEGGILFQPLSWATMIADKVELGSHNKSTKSLDGRVIRDCCVKLRVDRLGHIIPQQTPPSPDQ